MAPIGVSVPLRFLKEAISKSVSQIRSRVEASIARQTSATGKLQPIYAHAQTPSHQAYNRIKVAKRWYTTAYRTILHHAAINPNPSAEATGRVVSAMTKCTRISPFATTLRPNLSAGAFPRTASGYSLGNGGAAGARFFSHGPASPAQVISQVSQAMRAMANSGKNAVDEYHQRDGMRGRAGVRAQLAAALAQNGTAPGAYVDFHLGPTFTCLSRLSKNSIADAVFMGALSEDFKAIVADVTAVFEDLQKLATLGDLPVSLAKDKDDTIRVYFAGCDREIVERLCDEVDVNRGVIGEEEPFGFEFLMPTLDIHPVMVKQVSGMNRGFPHSTSPQPPQRVREVNLYWQDMLSSDDEDGDSNLSEDGYGGGMMTMSGTGSTPAVSLGTEGYLFSGSSVSGISPVQWSSSSGYSPPPRSRPQLSQVEVQGIQRFLEQCDEYARADRPVWG